MIASSSSFLSLLVLFYQDPGRQAALDPSARAGRGEREVAKAGRHGHGCYTPGFRGGVWRPGPWPPPPVNCRTTNSRTKTTMIPNTFTQHGVLVIDPRSGPTPVSPL